MPESNKDLKEVLYKGQHLQLVRRNNWEYTERLNTHGVVVMLAVTEDDHIVLIEQFREPLATAVIELPAGLAGDDPQQARESLVEAAQRELLEETGYMAQRLTPVTEGPTTPGLSSEFATFFRATQLQKVASGGGDDKENIRVHLVRLDDAPRWLEDRRRGGAMIDPKVYTGLFFAAKH